MDDSTSKLSNILKIISLFSVGFYVAGFFIWNVFLFSLQFNEIEILQSRFIYSGFFFFLYLCVIFIILYLIFRYILPTNLEISFLDLKLIDRKRVFLTIVFFIFIIFTYSIYIFPRIPRILGGGRPLALSIIPNKTSLTLEDLEKLGISRGEGSDTQTANLCVAYENSQIILILLGDRVIRLNKSQLNGIGALPEERIRQFERNSCAPLARFWITSGLY